MHELEEANAAYEAAEASIACGNAPKGSGTQDALKDSLKAVKRMTEVLEKMRKSHTKSD